MERSTRRSLENDQILLGKSREYAKLYPEEPEDRIWAAVAEAFDLVGDGARTIEALRRARHINPDWGRHRLMLAKAHLRGRQWEEAVAELEACADLDASGCDQTFFAENVLYYLGYALFGLGRYKEAAEAWRAADLSISFWRSPEPLKDFHLHRGWAHHLEHALLDALEAYRRGMVAPGPGDCSEDDAMDTDQVEQAQAMNERIEGYYQMAKAGELPDAASLEAVPYTS